ALIKPTGTVDPVITSLRDEKFTLIYSIEILEELADVLSRPRIARKYGISEQDIVRVVRLILTRGEKVVPQQKIEICRDPKDNKFLEAAVSGNADVIVSGDYDLLVLHLFGDILIISPREFLHKIEAGE
ncbi:MAG TPA: putative toxin-antitoxin system toxin component, PIN family, partial [Chloroflexi bacterium]|nr:putative toxin-antitoxin system toxin component, PIN family [Chloroflexota bacterium]